MEVKGEVQSEKFSFSDCTGMGFRFVLVYWSPSPRVDEYGIFS